MGGRRGGLGVGGGAACALGVAYHDGLRGGTVGRINIRRRAGMYCRRPNSAGSTMRFLALQNESLPRFRGAGPYLNISRTVRGLGVQGVVCSVDSIGTVLHAKVKS